MKTIYLAGPIRGVTFRQASEWRERFRKECPEFEYLDPLTFNSFSDLDKPMFTFHHPTTVEREARGRTEVVLRDVWCVRQADIVFVNFLGSEIISIGTVFEIGAAHALGKLVVVAMDPESIHRHPFIEQISLIVGSIGEAVELIRKLR